MSPVTPEPCSFSSKMCILQLLTADLHWPWTGWTFQQTHRDLEEKIHLLYHVLSQENREGRSASWGQALLTQPEPSSSGASPTLCRRCCSLGPWGGTPRCPLMVGLQTVVQPSAPIPQPSAPEVVRNVGRSLPDITIESTPSPSCNIFPQNSPLVCMSVTRNCLLRVQ